MTSRTPAKADQPAAAGDKTAKPDKTAPDTGEQTVTTTLAGGDVDDAGDPVEAAVIVTVTNPTPPPGVAGDTYATRGRKCVVSDGTPHMGRAVHGRVCSAHENRYNSDGSPRTPITRRTAN